jgi:Flp pilus assembly protein TadD
MPITRKNVPTQIVVCIILIFVTLVVYYPDREKEFINFDDDVYILNNKFVNSGLRLENVKWAFSSTLHEHWHPLTWLSFMLDCQIFGLDPRGYHFVNAGIHSINVLLLFWVFQRMTGAFFRSTLVAALFALHPLHVESVAWAVGRKDLLSMFFFLLAIYSYVIFTEKPIWLTYLVSVVFFCLGLLSKSMIITIPFVFLLLDLWPLGRLEKGTLKFFSNSGLFAKLKRRPTLYRSLLLVFEKLPFFIIAFLIAIVLMLIRHKRVFHENWENILFWDRIANALIAYMNYIGKIFWPRNLALPYPPFAEVSNWEVLFAAVFLGSVSGMVISWMRRFPFLFVGWFWFLGTLVPVIGIIGTGPSVMADRYCYLPAIGIYVMLSWGSYEIFRKFSFRKHLFAVVGGLLIVILTSLSLEQVKVWQNSITLFTHTLRITRDNLKAHVNLGGALLKKKRPDEAIFHFKRSLQIEPDNWRIHNNIGMAYFGKQDFEASEVHFRQALKIKPKNPVAYKYLGMMYTDKRRLDEAIRYLSKAVEMAPKYSDAHINLGIALAKDNNMGGAIDHFKRAIEINPKDDKAYYNLGEVYRHKGDYSTALNFYKKALQCNPKYARANKKILEMNHKIANLAGE